VALIPGDDADRGRAEQPPLFDIPTVSSEDRIASGGPDR
jgi:hypothetical protein